MKTLIIDFPRPRGCPPDISSVTLAHAIRELIYPGLSPDMPSHYLSWAESYYGHDAWYMLGALGRNHPYPIEQYQHNAGVLITWLPQYFALNQPSCTGKSPMHLLGANTVSS